MTPTLSDPRSLTKPSIRTWTGRRFHLHGNDPDEIQQEDIAHALSNICRFTGHIRRIYSVAEHSNFVAWITQNVFEVEDPAIHMQALLHDASEAYICDIAAPFKPALTNYYDLEKRVWERIANKYSVPLVMDARVKRADTVAVLVESILLQPSSDARTWDLWEAEGETAEKVLANMDKQMFLEDYEQAATKRQFLLNWEWMNVRRSSIARGKAGVKHSAAHKAFLDSVLPQGGTPS